LAKHVASVTPPPEFRLVPSHDKWEDERSVGKFRLIYATLNRSSANTDSADTPVPGNKNIVM